MSITRNRKINEAVIITQVRTVAWIKDSSNRDEEKGTNLGWKPGGRMYRAYLVTNLMWEGG